MVYDQDACDLAGFLTAHKDVFLKIAEETKCIIMSRAPGIYSKQLIEEGYGSKGFHDKAKSCNWGPMAGFVNHNPLFSKAGLGSKHKTQVKYIKKALDDGTTKVHLHISEARKKWLLENGWITEKKGTLDGTVYIPRFDHVAAAADPKLLKNVKSMVFGLRPVKLDKKPFHSVWYKYPHKTSEWFWNRVITLVDSNFNEQEGGGDPYPDVPWYKRATTADYDLFGCWHQKSDTQLEDKSEGSQEELDRRPVSPYDLILGNLDAEDPDWGNATQRLQFVGRLLNQSLSTPLPYGGGYKGGDLVHHSDEAGRPFTEDVDHPVIIFLPKGLASKFSGNRTIALGDNPKGSLDTKGVYDKFLKEFRELIDKVKADYNVELNPGWIADLGLEYQDYMLAGIPVEEVRGEGYVPMVEPYTGSEEGH